MLEDNINFDIVFHSELIKEVLAVDDVIKSLADELHHQKSLLVMGRGYNYATCLEGALVSTMQYIDREEYFNQAYIQKIFRSWCSKARFLVLCAL